MPFLTPQQFAKNPAALKPGASYAGYVRYVNRTRANRAAQRAVNPLSTFISDYQASLPTAAQQQQQAQQNVNQQIALQIAGAKAAQELADKKLAQQGKRAQGFALALGSLTQPSADQVKASYQEGADRLRAYGTGLTGVAAEIQQRTADQAAAHVAEITGGGVGTPTGLNVEQQRNTNQMLGTVIPGVTLEQQALSAVSEARNQAGARAQGIENIAQGYVGKQADLASELAAKKAEIQATRPALIAQAIEAARSGSRQDMATLISALALQNTTENTQSLINTRGKTAGATVTNAQTGQLKVTGVDRKTGAALPGFYYPNAAAKAARTPQKVPANMHVDPKNPYKLLPNKPGGAGSATATTKAVQQIIKTSNGQVQKVVGGPPYIKPQDAIEKKFGDPPTPALSYAEAKRRLLNAYVPKQYQSDPRVIGMIDDALASVGYKPVTAKPKSGKKPPMGVKKAK